ncbi:MAG: hypothetical protein A2551_00675 [Elusimicrobia bacterium RIFOXYD2_FULL_34_30]|nr:MAG: hypothetical protein A2551_00675 [Elusimicrobia bacterium RIFOXYD2_FULL_34_30]
MSKKIKEKVNIADEKSLKKWQKFVLLFFMLTVTFISYVPSLKNDFTNWDDNMLVKENRVIRDLSFKNIKYIFTSYNSGLYDPLVSLSFAIEYKFSKLNPRTYHTTNLILHLFNCLLVFWLFNLISKKVFVSFFVALLFGIHPMHVESVAWISERKDVLYALFFLGAMISYMYYLKNNGKKFFILSICIFLLSLMSKTMAVTLPLVLLLIDYIYNEAGVRGEGIEVKYKRNIIEKIPYFAFSLIFGVITIFAQRSIKNIKEGQVLTFIDIIFNVCNELIFYITKLFIPLNLSAVYPFLERIGGMFSKIFSISPIIIIILVLAVYFSKKHTKKIIFGSLFFLLTLLPVLNIIPIGRVIPADRYTYIPFLGLFYILGEGIFYFYTQKTQNIIRVLILVLLIAVIPILSYLTYQRCKVWKDSLTLMSDVIKKYPDTVTVSYNNRGNSYRDNKEYTQAIEDYTRAVKINPMYAEAFNNRGIAYFNMGDYDNAINDYTKSIELDPNYAKPYSNRGIVYWNINEFSKAEEDFNQAIKINQNLQEAYNSLGNVYFTRNDYDKAIEYYSKAIEIDPYYAEVYQNRSGAYFMKKDYDKAWADVYILQRLGYNINPRFLEDLMKASKRESMSDGT